MSLPEILEFHQRMAKALGKQIAASQSVICPNCREDFPASEGQPLSAIGDHEEQLFCPHCELRVRLTVTYHPDDPPEDAASSPLIVCAGKRGERGKSMSIALERSAASGMVPALAALAAVCAQADAQATVALEYSRSDGRGFQWAVRVALPTRVLVFRLPLFDALTPEALEEAILRVTEAVRLECAGDHAEEV